MGNIYLTQNFKNGSTLSNDKYHNLMGTIKSHLKNLKAFEQFLNELDKYSKILVSFSVSRIDNRYLRFMTANEKHVTMLNCNYGNLILIDRCLISRLPKVCKMIPLEYLKGTVLPYWDRF